MYIKRDRVGSTSHGHTWDRPGQILDIPTDHGTDLVSIPDAGFSVVEPEDLPDGWDRNPDDEADSAADEPDPGHDDEVTEPEPEPANAVDEAPKPRRGRPPTSKAKPEGE